MAATTRPIANQQWTRTELDGPALGSFLLDEADACPHFPLHKNSAYSFPSTASYNGYKHWCMNCRPTESHAHNVTIHLSARDPCSGESHCLTNYISFEPYYRAKSFLHLIPKKLLERWGSNWAKDLSWDIQPDQHDESKHFDCNLTPEETLKFLDGVLHGFLRAKEIAEWFQTHKKEVSTALGPETGLVILYHVPMFFCPVLDRETGETVGSVMNYCTTEQGPYFPARLNPLSRTDEMVMREVHKEIRDKVVGEAEWEVLETVDGDGRKEGGIKRLWSLGSNRWLGLFR
ncbi:hypothetical protein BJ508DRAFT_417992 [Ascobolus immersus RN42]|uniref:Uncharacterized protein n=1 Tax=Ascobolus immersus RN42 TaxID=1160509 RepID=A0A3N4HT83_ASCIM|nr:hypothetical protein BJ508DRAFT_417992 [Ascobolus immersus RN42]